MPQFMEANRMDYTERARQFAELHRKHDPIILFNAWDAGSARAIGEGGASAIATGSWSVAAAHGFRDGEALPLDLVIANLERIVQAVEIPVTLDFEGGYASGPKALKENVERVIRAGAVGINFEDQVVGGEGLYDTDSHCARIRAVRSAAGVQGSSLFINARTDLFLKSDPAQHDDSMLEQAITRSKAYAEAGASGFFAPGLREIDLIRTLCEQSPLPVNIMMRPEGPSTRELAESGVSRISYGPLPYIQAMKALTEASRQTVNP
jgi:2-methylisocitrate lyase-like PEP mutase family enzyme